MVLSDHPQKDSQAQFGSDVFWGVNVSRVESALAHLLSEGQEGVVITAHHELHAHKSLAAALHKATRSHSEAVIESPGSSDFSTPGAGMHSQSHTFIDPAVLMDELEVAADMLTHGLVSACY